MIIDCMETIYDKENVYVVKDEKRVDVMNFLEALTSNQFKILSDWLQKVQSEKKEVEWCCSKCKADNKMELRGLQSFFT